MIFICSENFQIPKHHCALHVCNICCSVATAAQPVAAPCPSGGEESITAVLL